MSRFVLYGMQWLYLMAFINVEQYLMAARDTSRSDFQILYGNHLSLKLLNALVRFDGSVERTQRNGRRESTGFCAQTH
jgi:hypothetical protein